jgi:hypothetical protein
MAGRCYSVCSLAALTRKERRWWESSSDPNPAIRTALSSAAEGPSDVPASGSQRDSGFLVEDGARFSSRAVTSH